MDNTTNPPLIPERTREKLSKVLSMADISYDLVGKLRARRYVSGTNYGELSDRVIAGLDAVGLVIRYRCHPGGGMKVTAQELEVIKCRCAQGLSRTETSKVLGIKEESVRSYIRRMFVRNEVSTRSDWSKICYEFGRDPSQFIVITRGSPKHEILSAYQAGRMTKEKDRKIHQ